MQVQHVAGTLRIQGHILLSKALGQHVCFFVFVFVCVCVCAGRGGGARGSGGEHEGGWVGGMGRQYGSPVASAPLLTTTTVLLT